MDQGQQVPQAQHSAAAAQSHLAPQEKFDGEADNLAIFLASIRDQARRFNWQ